MGNVKIANIKVNYGHNIARDGKEPTIDHAEVQNLLESIREHGVQTPVVVCPTPGAKGHYELVAGFTRFWCATQLQLETIPVSVAVTTGAIAAALENGRNAISWAGSYRTAARLREEGLDKLAVAAAMVRAPSYIELLYLVGDRTADAVKDGTLPDIVWTAPFATVAKITNAGDAAAVASAWNEEANAPPRGKKGRKDGTKKATTKVPPTILEKVGKMILTATPLDRWDTGKLFATLDNVRLVAAVTGFPKEALEQHIREEMARNIALA
jgi:hypothetical protein